MVDERFKQPESGAIPAKPRLPRGAPAEPATAASPPALPATHVQEEDIGKRLGVPDFHPLGAEEELTNTSMVPEAGPTGVPKAAISNQGTPFATLLAEAHEPEAAELANSLRSPIRRRAASETGEPVKVPSRTIGQYHVLEELGSGGMAVVYKAVQPSLEREVAIKELRTEYLNDRQVATRFQREATSLAALQHGNIVHVYDYILDFESAFIVMEYVEGIDVFDLLTATERVPPEIAAIIALQMACGLEYAHYRNIVHRDIKPSNVLISNNGEVKVMDFGIARDPGRSELTQVGIAVGTPAYMAPEQIRGDSVDFRTDIFALGIVLYEMLCGQKPWTDSDDRAVTVRVLDDTYAPVTQHVHDVPEPLVRVVEKCLRKLPKDRYASTYELRRDLEAIVTRHVPVDPRGRLVLFLRNRGIITDAQARNFVRGGLLGDQEIRRRDQGIPPPPKERLLKPVFQIYAAALAMMLIGAAVTARAELGISLRETPPNVLLAEGNSAAPAALAPAAGSAEDLGADAKQAFVVPTKDHGFVRVVVEPWARVFVDGEFYDFTPFAKPLSLPPGQHRISLRNPYFESVDRYVDVSKGETQILRISLVPKDDAVPAEGSSGVAAQ